MTKTNSDFTYILIVNYNTYAHTIECLESILKNENENYQIVIVDNSENENALQVLISWCKGDITEIKTDHPSIVLPLVSKPLSFELLNEQIHYPINTDSKIVFIKAKENNGFAAANNVGLKYLLSQPKFKWVWLLNNDTVIYPDSLDQFISSQFHSKTGIVGTILYHYNQPNVLQGIGGTFNKWLGIVKHIGEGEIDEGQYDNVKIETSVDYIIGASLFVSKEFILSVGLMCEDYFLYGEELDWTLRGQRLGWSFGWSPLCKVLHKEGSTISGGSGKSVINDICSVRSRVLITKKFYPRYLMFIYLSMIVVLLNRVRRMKFYRVKLLFKAIILNQEIKTLLKIN